MRFAPIITRYYLRIAAAFFLLGPLVHLGAEPLALHVSPTGKDTNPGTAAAPFATLERARDAIRHIKQMQSLPPGGVCVWLHGGIYVRTNTFELSALDAGTPAAPVVWRALDGAEVRITGAMRLDPSWFEPVTESSPVWSRLDAKARGHVMQVNLASHGITNYGTLRPRGFYQGKNSALELIFTNAPMPLARYPDPDENESEQTPTNEILSVYGDPNLDVTGQYTADGTSDDVNRYRRDALVNGRQYYLYRKHWAYRGVWYRAWFLSTNDKNGYPSNSDPWWSRYQDTLGRMEPIAQSHAAGTVAIDDPERINHGFLSIKSVSGSNTFTYAGTRPLRWTQAEEPWLHGFWFHYWADQHLPAVTIDTNTRTITLGDVPKYGIQSAQLFYALNLLEEITQPGEWYVNRRTGWLYFWPPAPLARADIAVSLLERPLWRLRDTTNIIVRDIIFENGRAELAIIEGGAQCALVHCVLRNSGDTAARVSGMDNGLSSCTILQPGAGGVVLSGGDRARLVPCRNFVRNCDIRGFSRWAWTYNPAVLIEGGSVGCLVSHNVIRDAPHTAVLFGRCNDCIIEFNDIGDVCHWSSDAGAVYIGRDWAARGNEVRWNFIHDVSSAFKGLGTQGIYLDDCQSGVRLFGNVIYNISHMAIQMGGGRDNIMENNVIARCGMGIGADGRGTGWMFTGGGSRALWEDLQRQPYRSAVWSAAYPLCAAIPTNWNEILSAHWLRPQNNVFSRNIGFANRVWTNQEDSVWTNQEDNVFMNFREMTDNIVVDVSPFVNETKRNFALRTDSPARAIPGFQPIPFESIGHEDNKALVLRVKGKGTVARAPAQKTYYPMQFVTLTATPAAGWRFARWSGSVNDPFPTTTLCMTNAPVVTAVFERLP